MFGETGKNTGENRRESWGKKKSFQGSNKLKI